MATYAFFVQYIRRGALAGLRHGVELETSTARLALLKEESVNDDELVE